MANVDFRVQDGNGDNRLAKTGDDLIVPSSGSIGTASSGGNWGLKRNGTTSITLVTGASGGDGWTIRCQVEDSLYATAGIIAGGGSFGCLSGPSAANRLGIFDGYITTPGTQDWELRRGATAELTVKSGEIEVSGILDVNGAGISTFAGDIDTDGEVTADDGFAVAGTTVINSSREIDNITQLDVDNLNLNGSTITNSSGELELASNGYVRVTGSSNNSRIYLGDSGDTVSYLFFGGSNPSRITMFGNLLDLDPRTGSTSDSCTIRIGRNLNTSGNMNTDFYDSSTLRFRANHKSGYFSASTGFAVGGATGGGPTLTGGTGVPAGTEPNSSLYMRSDGGAGTRLYQRQGAVWVAVI